MTTSPEEAESVKALLQRNAAPEATLASEREQLVSERERGNLLQVERDRLRESIRQLQFRLQLLERSLSRKGNQQALPRLRRIVWMQSNWSWSSFRPSSRSMR